MSKKRDEEEKFIYFNTRRLPEDVYSSEFAFSLIYNNIAPNRVQEAIDTVGLSRLPNVFFVVSVDDYSNESKKFQIRWEYTLKYEVLCVIRKYIERKGYEGLVANLIGTDQLACFFCMEMEETEESYEFLTHMAYEICREVKRLTSYTISICVTDFCDSVIKFADEYEKASLAFRESFYLGKEVQIRVVSNDGDDMQNSLEALLDRTMQGIYVSLSRGDKGLYSRAIADMFQAFNDMKKSREHAQLVANWMIDKMGEYCVRCGSKEVETVRSYTTGCKKEVLTCGYVKDICSVLEKCYDSMHAAIWEIKGRSMETAFQEPVQQYVRDHYKKKIMLEDIARQCGYSKYHFIRQFKKYFHTGLSEYVNLFRIEKSKELLAQGTYTIERVAEEAGFSSANYFEIVFRKYEGITPSEYRKRQTLGMEQ